FRSEAYEIMTAEDSQSSLSYCSLPRVTPSWSRANQLPNDSTRSTCPTPVMNSRRQFLIQAPVALLGAVAACRVDEQKPGAGGTTSASPTPGAPPAFNTAPPVGPEVSPATFSEAEKLVQVHMTDAQRQMMAKSWRTSMAALLERRTGPRKITLEPPLAPATRWQPASIAQEPTGPRLTGAPLAAPRERFVRRAVDPGPL